MNTLTWTQWDQESRTRASTLIASMGNFQLIITLTIMVNILDIIKGPTIKIQGRSMDCDVMNVTVLQLTYLLIRRSIRVRL